MKDREWFAWCFSYWADKGTFTVDLESYRLTDMAERIPPEGWVP